MEKIVQEGCDEFETLFKESIAGGKKFREGEVVPGTVVSIDKENALVDIGFKSEGYIPLTEFYDLSRKLVIKAGDHISVFIESLEDKDGNIVLSKEKADKMKIWDEIAVRYENEELIEGRIMDKVKGGLSVDIGIKAFLPGSQIDLSPVRDMDALLGKIFEFKIIKFSKKTGNIVLSRRVLLEKERESLKKDTIGRLEDGAVVGGIVKNITDYGAFIDLGGIDGLLHITDMAWGRVNHPSELFKIGQHVQVKVLKFDRESERVSLGLKQITEDPWVKVVGQYPIGTKITGRVVSIVDYGAFVEIEEGVEGLIHVSEMSWTKKIKHPSKVVSLNDTVEAIVLEVDPAKKRISLGLKQLEPNPWERIAQKYPVGAKVEGIVKNMTDFGMFIGIEDGIDGLVHVSDISWTQKIKHPSEVYAKGDTVEAVVLAIDVENERFSLGVKQLTQDPWLSVPDRYPEGMRISGSVTKIVDFGVFVKVDDAIEGLIHLSEADIGTGVAVQDTFNVGDTVEAVVLSSDPQERRLSLSIKALSNFKEAGDYQDYLEKSASVKAQLGDFINPKDMERVKGTGVDASDGPGSVQAEAVQSPLGVGGVVDASPSESADSSENAQQEPVEEPTEKSE